MSLGQKARRAVDAAMLAKRRLRKWSRITSERGPKRALFAYLAEGLAHEESIIAERHAYASRFEDLALHMDALDARITSAVSDLGAEQHAIVSAHTALVAELVAARGHTERLQSILEATRWYESAPIESHPLITVILPTRNRPHLVDEAIASVVAQTYANWELIVVDDAREGEAHFVGGESCDERLRVVHGGRRGLSAARNQGLSGARGAIITYLDDDNVMFPEWLRAVAICFFQPT